GAGEAPDSRRGHGMGYSGGRRNRFARSVTDASHPIHLVGRMDLPFHGCPGPGPQTNQEARTHMKTLRNIFGNIWVLLGLTAFVLSLAILWRNPGFGREDAIGGIIIFGIAFPLLAWLTTLKARPLVVRTERNAAEM